MNQVVETPVNRSGLEAQVSTTFTQSCLSNYNPQFMHHLVFETYNLYLTHLKRASTENSGFEQKQNDLQQEYERALNTLPFFRDRNMTPRKLQPYNTKATLLNTWANSINGAYLALISTEDEGVDPLYDPRVVFNRIAKHVSSFQEQFPSLDYCIGLLSKHGAKYLPNYLPELTEEAKGERIAKWRALLPIDSGEIITDANLSDIAHLGSKAMSEAFISYFKHHCLSGSLGESLVDSDAPYFPTKFEEFDVDHEYAFVRISQTVVAKYLMKKWREMGLESVADYQRLKESVRADLESAMDKNHEGIDAISRDKIDFLHSHMIAYLDSIFDMDISVLRPDTIPLISQLDALHVLRAEKYDGSQDTAIFAHEMGSGKTLPAVWADALYRKEGVVGKTLVVCRNQMKDEWKERFSKYLSDDALDSLYSGGKDSIKVISGRKSLEGIQDSSVVIVNYEMIHRSGEYSENESKSIKKLASETLSTLEQLVVEDEVFERVRQEVETLKKSASESKILEQYLQDPDFGDWIKDNPEGVLYLEAARRILQEDRDTIDSIFSYGADFLIVDEAHAIKNPSSKRSAAVNALSDSIPRRVLLTGTLIPNRYNDIDAPLKLVDKAYEPERINKADSNSTIVPKLRRIRQKLIPFLSRYTREDISPRTYQITHEDKRVSVVEMDEVMYITYRAIIEDPLMNFRDKTNLTRLATLNPAIAINKLHQMGSKSSAAEILEDILANLNLDDLSSLEQGTYVPPKYKRVAQELSSGGSVLVFTSHIDGNTRPSADPLFKSTTLMEYLEKSFPGKILLHDGQTVDHANQKHSERKMVLASFDREEGLGLVASYGTLGESVELTKGTKVLALDLPFALPEQAVGRTDRLTQDRDITIKYLTVSDPSLSKGTKSGLTIDQAVLQLGRDKNLVSSILLDGVPPGEAELRAYRNLLEQGNGTPWTYTPIGGGLELNVSEPDKQRFKVKRFFIGAGNEKKNSRQLVGSFEEGMMRTYIDDMVLNPGDYTHKSNQMVGQLIRPLLDKDQTFADIGGGPASLALAGDVTELFDIVDPLNWKKVMNLVLPEREIPFPENVFFHKQFLDDFARSYNGKYDFLVANNMLRWTSTQAKSGKVSETEQALRDMNGLLIPHGRLIVGLPGVYSDVAVENLEMILKNTGFGKYMIDQVTSPQDRSFHQLVAITTKTGRSNPNPVEEFSLSTKFSEGRAERGLGGIRTRTTDPREKKIATKFRFGETMDVGALLE
ncbi:DEAD/DEAH box helicase family protein [Candidatus Woesearchaeota archaeon]|nr:DEAD/DEAH box helicase family protein [Candidatus Woesearchaeota archaeon]